MPGLRPHLVEELLDRVGERFHVGFVQDGEGRRWVVRVPADAVAAAQLEESAALAELLDGKLPFEVPQSAGVAALRDGRRAVVYRLIPGRCVDFALLPPGEGLTTTLARAVAQIHNVDRRLFEEAGVPAYEADDLRRRRLADVDRGAATGLVPNGLLARWERMLDDVSWWRFAPTPIHGHLQDDHILLRFDDPSDAASAHVVGVTSWEDAQIADPAEDLAAMLARAGADTRATVLQAYAAARHEPPDTHLEDRASLLAELGHLSELLTARRLGDRRHLTHATEALRRLDDVVSHGRGSGNRSGTAVDRLPVDFEPSPAGQDLYHAGAPTQTIGVHAPAAGESTAAGRVAGSSGSDAASSAGETPADTEGAHPEQGPPGSGLTERATERAPRTPAVTEPAGAGPTDTGQADTQQADTQRADTHQTDPESGSTKSADPRWADPTSVYPESVYPESANPGSVYAESVSPEPVSPESASTGEATTSGHGSSAAGNTLGDADGRDTEEPAPPVATGPAGRDRDPGRDRATGSSHAAPPGVDLAEELDVAGTPDAAEQLEWARTEHRLDVAAARSSADTTDGSALESDIPQTDSPQTDSPQTDSPQIGQAPPRPAAGPRGEAGRRRTAPHRSRGGSVSADERQTRRRGHQSSPSADERNDAGPDGSPTGPADGSGETSGDGTEAAPPRRSDPR